VVNGDAREMASDQIMEAFISQVSIAFWAYHRNLAPQLEQNCPVTLVPQ
jgi:hypothetical protein